MSKIYVFLKRIIILHISLLFLTITAKIVPQQEIFYSNCFQEVCQKHFIGSSLTLILPKFNEEISDTFVKRLNKLYSVTIVDKNKNNKNIVSSMNKPVNILFFITSRIELIQSIKYLKATQIWNPLARVLVVLKNELVTAKHASLVNMSEIKKIFRIFMKERSIKVNLILFDEKSRLKIFAWFPFDNENNCAKRVQIVRLVGECSSNANTTRKTLITKTKYSDLPLIPRTFNNCPLVITAVKMEPYTLCNHQWICNDGIEIRLFESISKSLKLNLKLNVVERVDDTVYNSLIRRESDLVIGGIRPMSRTRSRRLTTTVAYYQDDLAWCVPAAKSLSLWLNIFLIFDGETWGYFILTIVLAGAALYYFFKFYHHKENWCYCTAGAFFLTISIPVPINPSHPLLRAYLMIICTFGVLVTATFNSFLMSTITRPIKFTQISTKQDLVNKSTELHAENEIMSIYTTGTDDVSKYFVRNFRSCTDINSCLEIFLTASSNNIAVATSREHAMHYPMIKDLDIYCFNKPEHVYPVAALAHEHFNLLEEINHEIQNAVEAGLIEKWESENKLMKKSNIVDNGIYAFSFQHISGCIIALAVGYTLASVAFFWEYYFYSKQKNAHNQQPTMWRVCEKIWVTQERDAWPEILRYVRWKRKINISNKN